MKVITLLFAICLSGGLWSQSLRQANNLFDKYEYALACTMFSEISETKSLSVEDYKRMAYGYYTIGDYKNCLPISDSILTLNNVEPFFCYMNAEANFGEGNYVAAKAMYIKYSLLDDEYEVANKIKSCDTVGDEPVSANIQNRLLAGNSSKANITGEEYLNGVIELIEVGQDSLGNFVDPTNIDNAELVLARPFLRIGAEEPKLIVLEDAFRDMAVTSFTLNDITSEVWVTITQPLALEQIDKVAHLYRGHFDAETLSIKSLERWMYSGYEDSSACAHATINTSGNTIVFSKSNFRTKGADLYQSNLTNGLWSKPTEITEFNTEFEEMYPQFMGDTLLSFSSDGHPGYGGLDIYISKVDNGAFGSIEHIASPVNGHKDDFNFNYYSDSTARYTSNRAGGAGDDDMYFIEYLVEREEVVVIVKPDSTDFFNFTNSFEPPIFYFEFDKFNLDDNPEKIKQLVSFLAKYPKSKIVVEGHTDRRGDKKYNLILSNQRAGALKAALIKKTISADQIDIIGKGNTEPLNNCRVCTEAMHAKNRYARIQLIAN
ncbi:MAG: outer membrane protein OmpA-like peptidoglycan-associated protein [Flavobacteriaceae bacterium]|jgi:outer membrane protein OmpA-like peptidoglycan-associated protein